MNVSRFMNLAAIFSLDLESQCNGGAGMGRKKLDWRLVGAAAKVHSVAVTLTPETGPGWSEKSWAAAPTDPPAAPTHPPAAPTDMRLLIHLLYVPALTQTWVVQ